MDNPYKVLSPEDAELLLQWMTLGRAGRKLTPEESARMLAFIRVIEQKYNVQFDAFFDDCQRLEQAHFTKEQWSYWSKKQHPE